jgi:quercetin dioxygenase-like cupin family protein
MRAKNILAFAVSFVVAAAVLAQAAGEAKAKSAPKAAANAPKFMAAADMKWVELDPKGAPGNQIADLWGDHTKGAFGALIKFPAGFSAPLHTHTYPFKIVIVSGTFIAGPEGKPEVRLGPGSYFWQPGGNYRHTTACDKASECVFFAESPGKFDLKPVAAAKAPAKKM